MTYISSFIIEWFSGHNQVGITARRYLAPDVGFYLDTELTAVDLLAVASILAGSGFSIDDLEHMLKKEVHPVFSPNLLSMAGEWAGWSRAYVKKSREDALSPPPLAPRSAFKDFISGHKPPPVYPPQPLPQEWFVVKALIELIRSGRVVVVNPVDHAGE